MVIKSLYSSKTVEEALVVSLLLFTEEYHHTCVLCIIFHLKISTFYLVF